ncbi:MAG: PHP domain-containing protein [Alistipes sp.]|nr:PHP domain-containing protein [Alistipes sp.]
MKRDLTNSKAEMHPFVHLHTHTEYSLLDGIAKISELVDKAMADGMPGIAITDHANMYGIAEFVEYVERKNRKLGTSFKPIIGCEVYVARRGMEQKGDREDFAGYHLVLLAKNLTGYKNLVKIVSRSWLEGYYGRPRTDHADLERYHEGLICCSACIGGEVAQHILHNDLASAEHTARWYKSVFGEDYYFELHRHKPTVERANHNTHKLEQKVNNQLLALSEKLDIKLICANDIHFVNEEDCEAQDALLCINSNKRYDDVSRLIFSKQEWLKTTAEMNELFGDIPEALENTIEIFNKVEHYSIDHAPLLPKPLLPEGVEEVEHLARLAFEGAYERFGKPLLAEVKERLKAELKIINRNGYPAYFLMWHEIIAAAHELGAQVGPGRGSAACSLVLYCLGITQVNPLQFDLAFNDFFNIEHALPRIEVEFDKLGREKVLKWIVERYGEECVANIAMPNYFTQKTTTEEEPQAQKLVGVVRKMDIHSCGVALCAGDISERVPLAFVESAEYENAVVVTQYGAEQLKRMGVEVLHILSSNILDIIAKCASRVALDIENIPLDDAKTLELFRKGGVEGVFRAAANEEQPLTFDDLVSLYSRHCSNRAHAICATLLAYRVAYLRAHYPAVYAEACNKR